MTGVVALVVVALLIVLFVRSRKPARNDLANRPAAPLPPHAQQTVSPVYGTTPSFAGSTGDQYVALGAMGSA